MSRQNRLWRLMALVAGLTIAGSSAAAAQGVSWRDELNAAWAATERAASVRHERAAIAALPESATPEEIGELYCTVGRLRWNRRDDAKGGLEAFTQGITRLGGRHGTYTVDEVCLWQNASAIFLTLKQNENAIEYARRAMEAYLSGDIMAPATRDKYEVAGVELNTFELLQIRMRTGLYYRDENFNALGQRVSAAIEGIQRARDPNLRPLTDEQLTRFAAAVTANGNAKIERDIAEQTAKIVALAKQRDDATDPRSKAALTAQLEEENRSLTGLTIQYGSLLMMQPGQVAKAFPYLAAGVSQFSGYRLDETYWSMAVRVQLVGAAVTVKDDAWRRESVIGLFGAIQRRADRSVGRQPFAADEDLHIAAATAIGQAWTLTH